MIKVDRQGRGVRSIEGNQSNAVSLVDIPMEEVSGYISPLPLTSGQKISRLSARAECPDHLPRIGPLREPRSSQPSS
ncbi:MAG: hypothetical protein ACKOL0_05190 [Solirubrobacterales bacterium]